MSKIEQAIKEIRAFAEKEGLHNATFAQLAGLHKNSLRHFGSDAWNPKVSTLLSLERVMDDDG